LLGKVFPLKQDPREFLPDGIDKQIDELIVLLATDTFVSPA
jgi:hypothetical protein